MRERIIAKDWDDNIKLLAFMDIHDKSFLNVHVYSEVWALKEDAHKEIMKHLGLISLRRAVRKAIKPDAYMFELRYANFPTSGGEPPQSFSTEGYTDVVWGFLFVSTGNWEKVKDRKDWQEYAEEEVGWITNNIIDDVEAFDRVPGLYRLKAGSLSDSAFRHMK